MAAPRRRGRAGGRGAGLPPRRWAPAARCPLAALGAALLCAAGAGPRLFVAPRPDRCSRRAARARGGRPGGPVARGDAAEAQAERRAAAAGVGALERLDDLLEQALDRPLQPGDVVWRHWVEEGTDQLVANMRLVVLEHDELLEFEGAGDSQEAAELEAAGAALAHLEAWLLEQIEAFGLGSAAAEGEGAVPGAKQAERGGIAALDAQADRAEQGAAAGSEHGAGGAGEGAAAPGAVAGRAEPSAGAGTPSGRVRMLTNSNSKNKRFTFKAGQVFEVMGRKLLVRSGAGGGAHQLSARLEGTEWRWETEPPKTAVEKGGRVKLLRSCGRGKGRLHAGRVYEVIARQLLVGSVNGTSMVLSEQKEGKMWQWETEPAKIAAEGPAATGRRRGSAEAVAAEGRGARGRQGREGPQASGDGEGPTPAEEPKGVVVPGGLDGAESAAILALMIDMGRRSSPQLSQAWEQYCDSRSVGAPVYDPARHDLGFLEGFFSYVGKRAQRSEADSA